MPQNGNVILESYAPGGRGHGRGGAARTLIQRSRLVRWVVKSSPAQHQIMTWRALTVLRGRPRFLALQLFGQRVGRYELRRSGVKFHVRHRTGDVLILNKIFARDGVANSYVPPPQVAAKIGAGCAPSILDVGANIGLFGVFALDYWPGAQITAFEPDPDNLRVLLRTVAANAVGQRWTVVDRAVSNAPGELSFVPGLRAEAHIAGADEHGTITVPTIDIYEHQGSGVDLVKIDIEGGEWAILADPRLSSLKTSIIRLEWHTLLCSQQDARAEAIRLLSAGGFTGILDGDREHERNGVLWAWREPAVASAPVS
jgi:FkbM family methyltransferase